MQLYCYVAFLILPRQRSRGDLLRFSILAFDLEWHDRLRLVLPLIRMWRYLGGWSTFACMGDKSLRPRIHAVVVDSVVPRLESRVSIPLARI